MAEQYDPSAKLNNPDTDFLEDLHNSTINRHRAELAAAKQAAQEILPAAEAASEAAGKAGLKAVEDALETELNTEASNKPRPGAVEQVKQEDQPVEAAKS